MLGYPQMHRLGVLVGQVGPHELHGAALRVVRGDLAVGFVEEPDQMAAELAATANRDGDVRPITAHRVGLAVLAAHEPVMRASQGKHRLTGKARTTVDRIVGSAADGPARLPRGTGRHEHESMQVRAYADAHWLHLGWNLIPPSKRMTSAFM
jgi:hypothetical protein